MSGKAWVSGLLVDAFDAVTWKLAHRLRLTRHWPGEPNVSLYTVYRSSTSRCWYRRHIEIRVVRSPVAAVAVAGQARAETAASVTKAMAGRIAGSPIPDGPCTVGSEPVAYCTVPDRRDYRLGRLALRCLKSLIRRLIRKITGGLLASPRAGCSMASPEGTASAPSRDDTVRSCDSVSWTSAPIRCTSWWWTRTAGPGRCPRSRTRLNSGWPITWRTATG